MGAREIGSDGTLATNLNTVSLVELPQNTCFGVSKFPLDSIAEKQLKL